jgi:hypothetical protein
MIPVNSARPLWDAKYGPHSEFADTPKTIDLSGGGNANVHLPNPSIWPLVVSLGLSIFALALIFGPVTSWLGVPFGVLVLLAGIIGWLAQPAG